jgi:hypothetical protein
MFLRDLNSHRANPEHLPLVSHYPHVLQVDFDILTLDPGLFQARLIRIRYPNLSSSDVN